MRRERRDLIDRLVAERKITQKGGDWLRKALDPYHDFEVPLSGMPDSNVSKVVVQEINLSQVVSVPANVTAGNSWDCHIFTLPEFTNHTGGITSYQTISQYGVATPSTAIAQANGQYPFGLANICTVAASADTAPGNTNAGILNNFVFDLSAYAQGQKRVIGLAMEIHDTTAELYKQGSCTVYRLPQVTENESISTGSASYAGAGQFPTLTKVSRCPPATLSQALLLAGTRQWESSKGAYIVGVMDEKANDLSGNAFCSRLFTASDQTDQVSANGFGSINITQATTPFLPTQQRAFLPIPFHTSGAYFAGLNYNSTLLVNLKVIVEVCPTPQNAQLVVLAQPSPDYDPVALEIYKAACARLPPGCPVGDNASGDFFDRILSIIGKVAPMVTTLPIPGARVLGPMLTMAAPALQQFRNQKDSNGFGANTERGQGSKNVAPTKKKKKAKSSRPDLSKASMADLRVGRRG